MTRHRRSRRRFSPFTFVALTVCSLAIKATADSITVAETWKDNTIAGIYSTSSDTGTFNASLTIPGLANLAANDWSNLTVTITAPGFSTALVAGIPGDFSDTLSQAVNFGGSITTNAATFFYPLDDTNGAPVNAYKIIFGRAGNTFTIAASTLNPASLPYPPWSIVAWNFLDFTGGTTFAFTNETPCEIVLRDSVNGARQYADISRTLLVTGTNIITQDLQTGELNNIRVAGSADFVAPTLAAVTPTGGLTTTNGLLNVQVKAADNLGVANVEFYFNGQDFGSGVLGVSNRWSLNFALLPGTNVIRTLATDTSGNASATNNLAVTFANTKTNANSVAIVERWLDYNWQMDDFGNFYPVRQNWGLLNAALLVPSLQSFSADTWSNLVLTIEFGDISFSNKLLNADRVSSTNAVFFANTTTDLNGAPVYPTTLTLSRTGNNLILVAQTANPSYADVSPLIAGFYYGTNGPVQDRQLFELGLADGRTAASYFKIARPVFITGTAATNFDTAGNELDNIQVSGGADFIPPTNQVTAPTTNQRWSNDTFTVTGKAGDNLAATNVFYSLNGGAWTNATTGNNWTNWSAPVALVPGTNSIAAFTLDIGGNTSPTNIIKMFYVLNTPLQLRTTGFGTLSPNYSNALLAIGQNFSLTATPGVGFRFSGWSGSLATNGNPLTFLMASNLALTANFADTNRPVLAITNLTAGQRVSNATFIVRGTAGDNWGVTNVLYRLNNTGWSNALSANLWSNWFAPASLTPGTNVLQMYSADSSGNVSPTNTLNFFYVFNTPLQLRTTGFGTLSPNYSNALLAIGQNFSLTATPGSGFAFTNWTLATNGVAGAATHNAALTFMMVSNLSLQADFADIAKPVVTITAPTANKRMTNALAAVTGMASDNSKVAGVWYQLNGSVWQPVLTTNNWTNWTTLTPLTAGTNTLRAYAADLGGNLSTTSSVSFISSNTFQLRLTFSTATPLLANGLTFSLQLSTNLNGRIQSSTNLLNWTTLANFSGTNSPLTLLDPSATNTVQKFYRAVVP